MYAQAGKDSSNFWTKAEEQLRSQQVSMAVQKLNSTCRKVTAKQLSKGKEKQNKQTKKHKNIMPIPLSFKKTQNNTTDSAFHRAPAQPYCPWAIKLQNMLLYRLPKCTLTFCCSHKNSLHCTRNDLLKCLSKQIRNLHFSCSVMWLKWGSDLALFMFLAGYFGCITRCVWKSGMQQNALSTCESATCGCCDWMVFIGYLC